MKFGWLWYCAALLLAAPAHALEWVESPRIAELFREAKVAGTFVVYDLERQRLIGHDEQRAAKRFVPASTYKIPHTLIGLATGAVKDVDEVLPYGGKPQPFENWERDMSLREAIALSAVPIYQTLARRIGPERMQTHLTRLDYGNAAIDGTAVDRFWLDGPLAVSAVEQTRFLAQLAQGRLPYLQTLQQQVRDIVLLETRGDLRLYGKTGWQNAPDAGVGWWVGWVQRGESVHPFALNLDVKRNEDAAKRVEIGKAALRMLGLYE